jgi:hypothetical protein
VRPVTQISEVVDYALELGVPWMDELLAKHGYMEGAEAIGRDS